MLELLKRYRTPLLVVGLLMTALLIYSSSLRRQAETTLFERAVLQLAGPVQRGFEASTRSLGDLWRHYLWLIDTAAENDRLHTENRGLRAELDRVREVKLTNTRLQGLLELRARTDLPTLAARIVAEDASSLFQTVLIDRGLEDGLREGLAVIATEGVVGRVIRCAPRQAQVLLVSDASSAMAVLVQRTRTRAICRGRGDSLTLDFARTGADITSGDRIVTSGTGGIFPKGLSVGTISSTQDNPFGLFQNVSVTPAVDFAHLEEVLVLLENSP